LNIHPISGACMQCTIPKNKTKTHIDPTLAKRLNVDEKQL